MYKQPLETAVVAGHHRIHVTTWALTSRPVSRQDMAPSMSRSSMHFRSPHTQTPIPLGYGETAKKFLISFRAPQPFSKQLCQVPLPAATSPWQALVLGKWRCDPLANWILGDLRMNLVNTNMKCCPLLGFDGFLNTWNLKSSPLHGGESRSTPHIFYMCSQVGMASLGYHKKVAVFFAYQVCIYIYIYRFPTLSRDWFALKCPLNVDPGNCQFIWNILSVGEPGFFHEPFTNRYTRPSPLPAARLAPRDSSHVGECVKVWKPLTS